MKLLSVNVSEPRLVMVGESMIRTGIFKEPINGRVALKKLNLEGDGQADLSVHGGKTRAAYIYPFEHYEFWRAELPDMPLPFGMFGENFTTEGLRETDVFIGDRYRIGTAEVMVTAPRLPCLKLGIKFGREDIIKRFMQSGFTGFYLSVEKEGEVEAGDEIELLERDTTSITVSEIIRLHSFEDDIEGLQRAVKIKALPSAWKRGFQNQLNKLLS